MAIIFQIRVESSKPKKNPEGYVVTKYGTGWDCTCPGWGYHHQCRHQSQVEQNYLRLRIHRRQELEALQHQRGWQTEEEYDESVLEALRKTEEARAERPDGYDWSLDELIANAKRQVLGTPTEKADAVSGVEQWRQQFLGH